MITLQAKCDFPSLSKFSGGIPELDQHTHTHTTPQLIMSDGYGCHPSPYALFNGDPNVTENVKKKVGKWQ